MTHRYQLERYSGKASRHTCPQCGHKDEYTLYIDIATQRALDPKVGKCNRVDKCGYHYTPSQYFKDNPTVHVFTNPYACEHVNAPEPTCFTLDYSLCDRSKGKQSNFIEWLSRIFNAEQIDKLIDEYAIGYTKNRRVIFWQIDTQGNIRTGKVMQYDLRTGRRTKGPGSCNWIHSMLKERGELDNGFDLRQCLFGEHLFAKYPERTIAVVESYKSACVGALVMPNFIWTSADSMSGLTTKRCQSLKGRNVIFFPDLGKGHKEWSEAIPNLATEIGFSYSISHLLERIATPEQRANGYDIADYITANIWQGTPRKSLADRLYEEEQATFDLLRKINPKIATLAKRFDLIFKHSKRPPKAEDED